MRNKRSNLSSVKDLVSDTLKTYHLEKRTKQELAISDWVTVVGEKMALASRPDGLRDGILFVKCRSTTWAQEMSFLKDHILKELNKRAGAELIKDIRFSGTGVKASKPAAGEEPDKPSPKDIEAIKLSNSELMRIAKSVEGVKDPDLANRIRRAMESGRKLEQWRLEHGWQKCGKCGILYRTSDGKCRQCA